MSVRTGLYVIKMWSGSQFYRPNADEPIHIIIPNLSYYSIYKS